MSQGKEFPSLQMTLRTGIASLCFQCPFSYRSKGMICPKQAFPYLEGTGARVPPTPVYSVVILYLTTLHDAFATILHLSPPMHLDLSPPYLSNSQMGLDCLIRESRHELSPVKLHPGCCQARDLCPTHTLIPLGPLSRSLSLPALDSRKGRDKFCLQGSVIC